MKSRLIVNSLVKNLKYILGYSVPDDGGLAKTDPLTLVTI